MSDNMKDNLIALGVISYLGLTFFMVVASGHQIQFRMPLALACVFSVGVATAYNYFCVRQNTEKFLVVTSLLAVLSYMTTDLVLFCLKV